MELSRSRSLSTCHATRRLLRDTPKDGCQGDNVRVNQLLAIIKIEINNCFSINFVSARKIERQNTATRNSYLIILKYGIIYISSKKTFVPLTKTAFTLVQCKLKSFHAIFFFPFFVFEY